LIAVGILSTDSGNHIYDFEGPHVSYKLTQNVPGNFKIHRFKTIGAEQVPSLSKFDKNTMAIWVVQGRDPEIKNPPPFHVVIRVGDKVYDYDEKPGYPKSYSAADYRAALLKRSDKPIVQEIAFGASDDLMRAHQDHYQALMNGTIVVDGKKRDYHYDVGGFGVLDTEGPVPMNCFSWVLTAWQQRGERSPVIEKWSKEHDMDKITREGSHSDAIKNVVAGLGGLNVVTWGVDATTRPGFDGKPGHHFDYLLNKVFRIKKWKDVISVQEDP
jgi:hypothetical protein